VGQGDTRHEVADQERHGVAGADLVDTHDSRVPKLRDAAALAEEPFEFMRPGQVAAARYLERHHPVQLRIERLVEGPEATLTDHLYHFVLAEVLRRGPAVSRPLVQTKGRAAGRTDDLSPRLRGRQRDGVAAMGTVQLHGSNPDRRHSGL